MNNQNINFTVIKTRIFKDNLAGVKRHQKNGDSIVIFEIPINKIKEISKSNPKTLNRYGLYILVSQDNNDIYVGETSNLKNRMNEHLRDEKKDFNKIFAIANKLNFFTKSNLSFLEKRFIKWFTDNSITFLGQKVTLSNETKRDGKSRVNDDDLPAMLEYSNKIEFLLEQIGFDKIKSENNEEETGLMQNHEVFQFKDTKIKYIEGQLFVLKGSKIANVYESRDDYANNKQNNKFYDQITKRFNLFADTYDKLFNDNKIKKEGNQYLVLENFVVSSPSFAACIANGSDASNGWVSFKNNEGKTLKNIYKDEENEKSKE